MWSAPAICIVCILFASTGIICDVEQTSLQPKLMQRTTNQTPGEGTKLEEDIQKVIDQIHSLSNGDTRSFSSSTTRAGFDLNTYYGALMNLYNIFQPLLRENFLDDLPKITICILSGRQDCGLEAELTKTVSLELAKPLLTFLTTLRSQTCSSLTTDEESGSFFRTYLRMGDSAALSGFQETFINILSSLSLSKNLINVLGGLIDATVTYALRFAALFIQVPMDYTRIALQFGIKVPVLDEKETCQQGDLQQLIMWGIKNNVSWSLSTSLIDILLDIFLPQDQSAFMHPGPECQTPPSAPSQRSISYAENSTMNYYDTLCDSYNLATINDTMCAEILSNSGVESSTHVVTFCEALSSLSSNQMKNVWSNMCYVIQTLASPLVSRSSDCSFDNARPAPATTPLTKPRRVAREASNLRQLACNYNDWLQNNVDPVLVSLCSDNERVEFVKQVCSDAVLMRKLLSEKMNSWLYGYCANSSADYMVSEFCQYDQWLDKFTNMVDTSLLAFCMSLDSVRLTNLICENTGFFMFVMSNPEHFQFMPNCTNVPPPLPIPGLDTQLDFCHYSEWHEVEITNELLTMCILFDQSGFTKKVCSNATFLDNLLLSAQNTWLEEHCRTSLSFPHPEPTEAFNIGMWCDYNTWGERQVDDSVIGLCWQNDQSAFQKSVCCKQSVLEKLLQNPLNKWLISVCTDMEEITVPPQVCKYSDWTRPIIVDMTEVALCAEMDQLNFTSRVCANNTVLQNLLANQDNTWLIQHCANYSKDPGTSSNKSVEGVTKQCQYSSWITSPPDAALLALCWENDQTNFFLSICPNDGLLLFLSREPWSQWVNRMCTTYTTYTNATTTNNNSNNNTSTTTDPNFCLARNLVKEFNWSCPTIFASACQPCATQNMVLQTVVRCWVDSVRSKMVDLLTPPVARALEQAVSTTVVVLLSLEEVQITQWHVTETIRPSVLKSVINYFKLEGNSDNKRVLLQCFGTVLSRLLQTGRNLQNTDEMLLIKAYFNLSPSSLRPVLKEAHNHTIRLILQYYASVKDTLQLPNEYLSTMVSEILQTHLVKDVTLFPELAPMLTKASPADIQALPPWQNNINVRDKINEILKSMTPDQQQAFGLWYSKALSPSSITRGQQSLIKDTGNLIAYLPFQNFQHLSAAQLLDGLDVLQRNTLTPLKQEFVARNLISTYRNLTAQDFSRLGSIACLADPDDLYVYKGTEAFSVIRESIMSCTRKGLRLPSDLVFNILLNTTELQVPSAVPAERLAEIALLLPSLGVTFLQGLSTSQLLSVLPTLNSIPFSPAQAAVIVDKLSSVNGFIPDRLGELGSLIVGVKTETLLMLTSDKLLSTLVAISQHTQGLCLLDRKGLLLPPQANAIATKLWGFPEVVTWLNDVAPLLGCTPLISVLPRKRLLVNSLSNTSTKPWNTQQARGIFREVLDTNPNLIKQHFLSLGTLGQGVSCAVLRDRFQANRSPSSARSILALLRQQPGLLHTSLKNCIIEVLYQFEFFFELLEDLGVEIALSMPVSAIKRFSTDMMNSLRRMIIAGPHHFLLLSRTKQLLLVDKMAQRLDMYTGVFTEEEFRLLDIMAPFVVDEVFIQVDRRFFIQNLDFLHGLCYSSTKMEIVARILQEPAAFGPVENWDQTTLSQVDRFLFFLPQDKLQQISLALMTVEQIEKLFMSHHLWERGDIGMLCSDETERKTIFERQQFVLQFFLGFLKLNSQSLTPVVPTCEILHTTAPSVWLSSSLTSMPSSAFSNCLELMGHDPFLASYQRTEVLRKVKQIYGPVSSFSQAVISQLGVIATQLSLDELNAIRLTERRSIAALGTVSDWNSRQLATLFSTVLNSTKQNPSQLDSSTLVAMGYIVCGAKTTELRSFNPIELSKAVLRLGRLRLSCSEEQLQALVELLTHSLVFGLMSSWGTDVFIEIGVLAVGIPDMAMSALVKEQIEGIAPLAISMMAPKKFAVVFSQEKIAMFSYEQAVAVTDNQRSVLSDLQKTALAMVLTPWDDKLVDFRGRSLGLALSHSPLCLLLGLLMLLTVLLCPDT
ncbi:stereocilin [Haplochromis burtoni]|uniref:stereocilin n=1 Tax=Haplochromis burtoni TaxID=8153 RepID=UPI001C2D7865|nr:stereocilin [Haplochromis burtoni]